MPHISDGALEAYLDGEIGVEGAEGAASLESHLSACEDCRTRLAEAGRRRERAGGLLEGVPAEAGAPAFETVLERAGRSPDPYAAGSGRHPRHRRFRPIPLAWAASVLISAGAGWFGRRAIVGGAAGTSSRSPAAELVQEKTRTAAADRFESMAESAEDARGRRVMPRGDGAKVAAKRTAGGEERVGAVNEGLAALDRGRESTKCLRLILDAKTGSSVDSFLAGSRDLLGDTTLLARAAGRGTAGEAAAPTALTLPLRTAGPAAGPVAGFRLEAVPCDADADTGEAAP